MVVMLHEFRNKAGRFLERCWFSWPDAFTLKRTIKPFQPSAKLMADEIGILELDGGCYEPTCVGVVPSRINDKIRGDGGISGAALLSHFGGPPYGYPPRLLKACVAEYVIVDGQLVLEQAKPTSARPGRAFRR